MGFDKLKINGKSIEMDVEKDNDGKITIHFGDVKNEDVKEYQKEIEKALGYYKVFGDVTILTTQGIKTSLLSVMYYPNEDDEEEYFLNIDYI